MEAEISVAESTIFPLTKANVEFRRLKRSKCWAFNNLMRSHRKKSKKQMSVIVEVKRKMKAVTNENVKKESRLTPDCFDFLIVWSQFLCDLN